MAAQVFIGPEEVIRRLLRLEHGVRKCARIMLFMTRKQLVPILVGLPRDVLIAIAREMAKLKGQLGDLAEEREKIRDELGLLADVLELAAPERKAHEAFGFLDDVAPQALVALSGELSTRSLATLACYASADAAVEIIAGVREHDRKSRLVDAMTRVHALSDEDAEELADATRTALEEAYNKLRERDGLTSMPRVMKGLTRVLKKPAAKKKDEANTAGKNTKSIGRGAGTLDFTTSRYSLADLLEMVDARNVQKALGTLPTHVLALALANSEASLSAILRGHLSSGRLDDVNAEIATLDLVDDEEGKAARRAIAKKLIGFLHDNA